MLFNKQSAGKKNFERCPHRQVMSRQEGPYILGVNLVCPATEDQKIVVKASADLLNFMDPLAEHTTNLRIQEEGGKRTTVAYRGQEFAVQHLGRTASEVVCKSCPYSSMTAIEVSQTRAEIAREAATLAMYEEDRLAALADLHDRQAAIARLKEQLISPQALRPTDS